VSQSSGVGHGRFPLTRPLRFPPVEGTSLFSCYDTSVLGVLLPGVRDVRAPLVAGALLLVAAYLLLFDSADSVVTSSEVSPGLESLYELLGRNGLLAAAALVAYLVGTVFTRLMTSMMRGFTLSLVPRVATVEFMEKAGPRWLHFCRPFSRPSIRRITPLCRTTGCDTAEVLTDIVVSGGKRLLSADKDLYMEYDRLRSEADLRVAVVAPALLLAVVVAFQVPANALTEVASIGLVAVLAGVIFADALALNRHAHSMYAHAVADRVISTPSLDEAGPTNF
jgi:hypothetical protein